MRVLAVLLLTIAVTSPAAAQTIPIPFAPPLGKTLSYRIVQHRAVGGKPSSFTAARELRFERDGSGYLLRCTLKAIDSDAPDEGAAAFRAAMTPLTGIAMTFRVDAGGEITGLDNLDGIWQSVERGQKAMHDGLKDGPRKKAATAVGALFASLSPEARLALLAGELQPLFLFAGSQVEAGPAGRGVKTVAGSPLGRPVPVKGVLRVTGQADGAVDLQEDLTGIGIALSMTYRVSRNTGLVEGQDRALAVGSQSLTENRVLTASQN